MTTTIKTIAAAIIPLAARMSVLVAAGVTVGAGLGGGSAQEPTLEIVLARAATYVADYRRVLGTVIAQEEYLPAVQRRIAPDGVGPAVV